MSEVLNGPLTTDGIEDDSSALAPDAPPAAPPESRGTRILKNLGWAGFGLFLLILFTILKLPDERIKAYVQGAIAAALAPKGITFNADKGYISLGYGFSYVMKDVTLNFPPPQLPAHIDKISVSPSILPLLFGYQGGSLALSNGEGKLTGSFSMKGSQISASFDAKQLDFGKLGLLSLASGVRGTGMISGSASIAGDMSIPSTLVGDINLDLSKVVLDAQTIVFFNVPRVSISEGKIEVSSDKGKATIKTLRLGKPGSTDDIIGSGSGDVILGRNWDSSTLSSKINVKLSDPLMKAFILIDSFLGPGKQGDGSYSLTLSGPVTAPNPVPLRAGAR
jgi:type II secretion system protein N